MDFYLFDSVRREGMTKDGRPIRLPSEKKLLESGTFHSDHSITFTHHTADRFIKNRKPLSYEGFSEDYWNNLSEEIVSYTNQCNYLLLHHRLLRGNLFHILHLEATTEYVFQKRLMC